MAEYPSTPREKVLRANSLLAEAEEALRRSGDRVAAEALNGLANPLYDALALVERAELATASGRKQASS